MEDKTIETVFGEIFGGDIPKMNVKKEQKPLPKTLEQLANYLKQ